ncbi:MAG: hypothetical protein OSJ22_02265 [Rikenellaceae bacterium]|nr:hypothetical protein [Rikenellaceae bacterium]
MFTIITADLSFRELVIIIGTIAIAIIAIEVLRSIRRGRNRK